MLPAALRRGEAGANGPSALRSAKTQMTQNRTQRLRPYRTRRAKRLGHAGSRGTADRIGASSGIHPSNNPANSPDLAVKEVPTCTTQNGLAEKMPISGESPEMAAQAQAQAQAQPGGPETIEAAAPGLIETLEPDSFRTSAPEPNHGRETRRDRKANPRGPRQGRSGNIRDRYVGYHLDRRSSTNPPTPRPQARPSHWTSFLPIPPARSPISENGGDKLVHGSGGISQLRAE